MAEGTRDRIAKARETATGLKRVSYAVSNSKSPGRIDPATFIRPIYLQEHVHRNTKSAIFVYEKFGVKLMEPFYNIIISKTEYTLAERVSRTATMDGEHRIYLGKAPTPISFVISLLDYQNQPWKDQFIYMWNEVLRGTVAQEADAKIYVYSAGDLYIGDMSACVIGRAGETDGTVAGVIHMDCDLIVPYLSGDYANSINTKVDQDTMGMTNEQIETVTNMYAIKKGWEKAD